MSDPTVIAADPPPPENSVADYDSALSIPALDTSIFSQQDHINSNCGGDDLDDVVALEDFDFDFSMEDLCLPPSEFDDLGLPDHMQSEETNPFDIHHGIDPNLVQFGSGSELGQFHAVFKSNSSELRHLAGKDVNFTGDDTVNDSGALNSDSPVMESNQVSCYLNMPSPESNGSNRESDENCVGDVKVLGCHSPETQGSGNCRSNVSEEEFNNNSARSGSCSPNSNCSSVKAGVVDQEIKLEDSGIHVSSSVLKRKKEVEDLTTTNLINVESRISKFRKSNCDAKSDCNNRNSNDVLDEEEDKKKARLVRNRESAQLSRQRKKHYVEELEDKVRTMHSTIQDLNAKVSYFMAENVTLRQQMGGTPGGGTVPPPPMAPPPPGMYPHPAMMYPWMPCAPPYVMKPQGSQVPLLPIPRLKPQQSSQAPKTSKKVESKKVESKKNEGSKTKKVAGISFMGLLFFILLFGGLVPMINLGYGGVRESLKGGGNYIDSGFYAKHRGRSLMSNGTGCGENLGGRTDFRGNNSSVYCGPRGDSGDEEFANVGNSSEPLVASLYVPRNDKLVKIDGNLIIRSVLASEKAMASNGEEGEDNGSEVLGDLTPTVGMNAVRHPHLKALGSGSSDKENSKSKATDGSLQKWFREGLAGPMLSTGMCTEVFQFDVSSAIVPASPSRNISKDNQTSTHLGKGNKNRRFLHDNLIPLPGSSHNNSKENTGRNSSSENLNEKDLNSSMVVSVLFDPREAGDADVEGVMGKKSLSRIFVVVLKDSVKYVTYSCILPFKGSAPHLVTT